MEIYECWQESGRGDMANRYKLLFTLDNSKWSGLAKEDVKFGARSHGKTGIRGVVMIGMIGALIWS